MILMLILLGGLNVLQASISTTSVASLATHLPIVIIGNSGFTPANGVSSGTGRQGDPYIIQGWDINASGVNGITLANTTSFFEITNVNIHGAVRGIFLLNATNGMISNNIFSRNQVGISLQSSPNDIVSKNQGSNNGEGILVVSSGNVNISNNTVTTSTGWYGPGQGNTAIFLTHSGGSIVDGNNVSMNTWGIFIDNSPRTEISRNLASLNNNDGIHVENSGNLIITGNNSTRNGTGIFSGDSPNTLVSNNALSWNIIGVFYGVGNETVSNNSFFFNRVGLECGCGTASVKGNNFVGDGLVLDFRSPSINITSNMVNGKPLLFYDGCSDTTIDAVPVGQLIMANCVNVQISNLQITNTSVGIQLINVTNTIVTHNSVNSNSLAGIEDSGTNITITLNNISNNSWSTAIDPSTQSTHAYHNNFIYDDVVADRGGVWDNSYPSGGNFWTDYTGIDHCSGALQNFCTGPDGIGDTPFQLIGQGAMDHYPLMRPYLLSPDATPPFWLPQSVLTVSNLKPTSFTISWPMAADDLGVAHYLLYQDGTWVSSAIASTQLDVLSRTVSGLMPGATYTFKVEAVDWAGNPSSNGPHITVTMPLAGASPPQILGEWWLPWVILAALAVVLLTTTPLILRRWRALGGAETVPKAA
jgi:parallel beta-helix repeat protein